MEKLKKRWGISSNFEIAIIILVFGITGSSSVYIAKPILNFLGVYRDFFHPDFFFGGIFYYIFRILLFFPIYQVLLVSYGWLFGQFQFFWNFEKKMLSRIGLARFVK